MGVDRTKFKTCEQSSFCQRNRNHQPFEQDWALDLSTIVQDGMDVSGQLTDKKNPVNKLKVILSMTEKGALRMKVDELNPTRHRFEAKDALNPSLNFKKLKIDELNEYTCHFSFGYEGSQSSSPSTYRLRLTGHPFKAEVLDQAGNIIVLLNSRGLMRFEVYKEQETQSQPLLRAPREAQAYDETGKPVGEQAGNQEEPHAEAQVTEQQNDVKSYAESFSTFTDTRPYGPMSVGLDIHFPNSDHLYGIPEHADSFQLKDTRPNIGDPYRLYNVDIFEYELNSPMALYGSIPFMIAQSKNVGTFGVYWLNPSETWIDIESNHSHSRNAGVVDMISSFVSNDKKMTGRFTHWFSETGLIDIWFLPGPNPTVVSNSNAEIFGTMPLVPPYSIGFHQCRWNYYSGDEVMQVERGYDMVDTPLDAIWLDIEYTAGRSKKYFTWDSTAFGNHIEVANNLSSRGRRLIAIIDPHIKKEDGYDIYEEGNSLDLWIKDVDGQKNYEGWCWPGASLWPDFSCSRVRDWWATKFNPSYFPGEQNTLVDLWNDMNEPSVFNGPEVTAPRDLRHTGGWEHRDIHNMYGFYVTQATFEGLVKYRSHLDRPFILTRSFFAGSQRFSSVWTGDNQASWSHLRATVPMELSISMAGMPFVGADVGGFFNNPESEELLIRWFQAGAFQPFFRAHAHHDARHREAYIFQGQTLDLLRDAVNLRYSFIPYWYTLFFEAHLTGVPMMRPTWYHESSDENAYNLDDQHLVGQALLVKPVLEKGVTSTEVYLPTDGQTEWFSLNSHTMHTGGESVVVPVHIGTIPMFQRAGSIIPRQHRLRKSVELLMPDPVSLHIVLSKDQGKSYARGYLYVDDFKKLEPDSKSATLKEIVYFDDYLYVKTTSDANLTHGLIERVIIYNWPSNRAIKSVVVAPDSNNYSNGELLEYYLDEPRADGTVKLEIKRPQISKNWKVWMLKIESD